MVSRLTFVAVMVEKQTEASSKCILKERPCQGEVHYNQSLHKKANGVST